MSSTWTKQIEIIVCRTQSGLDFYIVMADSHVRKWIISYSLAQLTTEPLLGQIMSRVLAFENFQKGVFENLYCFVSVFVKGLKGIGSFCKCSENFFYIPELFASCYWMKPPWASFLKVPSPDGT